MLKLKNKKAFTLVELIVIMAVVGILVLLATPKFMGHTKEAKFTKFIHDREQIENASERYYMDTNDWPKLSDEHYTADQVNSFSQKIFDETGKEVILDPDGQYYDIDYDKLQKYVRVNDNPEYYILQNPVGSVYLLEGLTDNGKDRITGNKKTPELTVNDGLISQIYSNDYSDGLQNITINGVTYNVNITNFYDDVHYTTSPTITTTTDGPMVILKYHKNLTIDSGVTITPNVRTKGMLILVKGTLTNSGTISMTSRGASAVGQNIYLWQNADSSYEYVPAVGALGGANYSIDTGGVPHVGYAGINGVSRQSGGGGSGGGRNWLKSVSIGKGGSGTSYSGGVGSAAGNSDGSGGGNVSTPNASNTGGAGTPGITLSGNSSGYVQLTSGGQGNNGGGWSYYRATLVNEICAVRGTGGLLIIYANQFDNNGNISSNGGDTIGGKASVGGTYMNFATGGASGGGSINIFYTTLLNSGTITANGGKRTNSYNVNSESVNTIHGGVGGKGSITLTQVD